MSAALGVAGILICLTPVLVNLKSPHLLTALRGVAVKVNEFKVTALTATSYFGDSAGAVANLAGSAGLPVPSAAVLYRLLVA